MFFPPNKIRETIGRQAWQHPKSASRLHLVMVEYFEGDLFWNGESQSGKLRG